MNHLCILLREFLQKYRVLLNEHVNYFSRWRNGIILVTFSNGNLLYEIIDFFRRITVTVETHRFIGIAIYAGHLLLL